MSAGPKHTGNDKCTEIVHVQSVNIIFLIYFLVIRPGLCNKKKRGNVFVQIDSVVSKEKDHATAHSDQGVSLIS